ncbi:nucleotidyltransferase family protein [Tateyamaria sp. SN6-1]|uniref:nucleotidyltransferase family protein n=1 Tax=Tateyamaria sp. SN6-1 TaxID=3092148 RepID=UPI0039F45EDA
MTMPLMLFAAGFGTRMGALTKDRPKPLIHVAGRPLIDHALEIAQGAGVDRIVANLHYRAEMIEAHVAERNVLTIRETPDILETGGGLRAALPLLDSDTVMTLNSDAVWAGPNPLMLAKKTWEPARMDALLVCVPVANTHGYSGTGDFQLQPDGQITRGSGLVYAGAHILKTDMLHEVDEAAFSLNVVWNRMAERGRLFGVEYAGQWCDVGHPAGIAAAEQMLAQQDV